MLGVGDPHRDWQSYPRKGFPLFQEMDLSGAGWWPVPQLLTSGSVSDWENLPIWLLRQGWSQAPVSTVEGQGGSRFFPGPWLPPASPCCPGSWDLVSHPRNVSLFGFRSACWLAMIFTKRELLSVGGGHEKGESSETHWSPESRKAHKWLSELLF